MPGVIVDFGEGLVDLGGIADDVLDDRDIVLLDRVAAAVLVGVELETIARDPVVCSIRISGLETHIGAAIGRSVCTLIFIEHEDEAVGTHGAVVDAIFEVDLPDFGREFIIGKGRYG